MRYKGWNLLYGLDLCYFPFETDNEDGFLYSIEAPHNNPYMLIYPYVGNCLEEYEVCLNEYFEEPSRPTLEELVMFELEFSIPINIMKEGLGRLKL